MESTEPNEVNKVQRESEVVSPATEPNVGALAQRGNAGQDWAKIVAVVVAVCALFASAASAIAAWQSWKTARDNLQFAREAFQAAGPYLELSSNVRVSGDCSGGEPLAMRVTLTNKGRLAADGHRVTAQVLDTSGAGPGIDFAGPLLGISEPVGRVEALSDKTVDVLLRCAGLTDAKITPSPSGVAEWVANPEHTLMLLAGQSGGGHVQPEQIVYVGH